jgi:hypothetical protein
MKHYELITPVHVIPIRTRHLPLPTAPAIYNMTELGSTMGLQDVINERVSFLKEQINPKNKPDVNAGFQVQMDYRSCQIESIAFYCSMAAR